MRRKVYVKNMVCDRCIAVINKELQADGFDVDSVILGEVILKGKNVENTSKIQKVLKQNGFELIKDESELVSEKIKIGILDFIKNNENGSLSNYLETSLGKEYSVLSKLFSKRQGTTIEKYCINLKIEKAKELVQMQSLSFSEIAYILNYKSSSHLASQFKAHVGLSMSKYKKLKKWNRKSFDKIL